ncbi:MAG: SDR family oxidoreductase [Cyanobacteria bacterium P01_C01_bin.38]
MHIVVFGATGLLGGKVVNELLDQGDSVTAVVRDFERAKPLANKGVALLKGDLKDIDSLHNAFQNMEKPIDGLVTTAYGYSRSKPGDTLKSVDDRGNKNLVAAAKKANVGRFVFTSILTADKAVNVPHFYQKSKTEEVIERSGLDWVSLRPGGFLDTLLTLNEKSIRKGKLMMPADLEARTSVILSDDVAKYLAKAFHLTDISGERIDLGIYPTTNLIEIAEALSEVLGHQVKASSPPKFLTSVIFRVIGLFNPFMQDNIKAMEYVSSGKYVADLKRQTELFGEAPTLQDSLQRWAAKQ